MANTSFNFDIDPYYDDFQVSGGPREQNYMRILFRPGKAVQARELTQIQSILQNQIKAFGDHIFKDGSPVEGGHLTIDVNAKSVKLLPQYDNVDIDLAEFSGQLIKNTGNAKAVVVATDDTQVYPTVVVKYLSAEEFSTGQTVQVSNTTIYATTIASSATANASTVSINEGIFYVDGYFVYVEPQSIVLDAYSRTPSYKVGLQIVDTIIDESEDASLLDPAQESFNYQAPGATRYQFNLELTKRALNSTDDSKFFELLRVENGIITKQVLYPLYSEIEKTLARRTYDESGDYTVKPFRVTASPSSDPANTFQLNIEPGKAYVKGYEFETIGTVSILSDKATTNATSSDYGLSLDYGNYIVVNNLNSGGANGLIGISSYEQFDLHVVPTANINTKNSIIYSNTKIGTARIRNVDFAGGTDYYAYLVDINTAPRSVTIVTGTSNTSTVNLGAYFADRTDAYKGVNLKVASGTGVDSYTREITSYNGASKVATVDIPFSSVLDTTSTVTLIYNVKDIDSIVEPPPVPCTWDIYKLQPGAVPYATCMDVSTNGKTVDGKAVLYDTNKNALIYRLPETYITGDAFSSVNYYKKKETSCTATVVSGNVVYSLTLSGDEKWFFGSGTLSSLTARNNFIVTKRSDGSLVDFTVSPNTVTQTSDTVVQINVRTGDTGSQTVDIIYTVEVENTAAGSKTLKGNTSNVTLTASDTPFTAQGAQAVLGTSSGVMINKTKDAHVWFKTPTYIQKTPGVAQSLYITDVIRLIRAYDSGNIAWAPNSTNAIDITSRYILDGGQRDNYYDFATITLRDGAAPPSGQTVFMVQCFDHTRSTFFNAASYSGVYATNDIPNYANKDGVYSLRDMIDFRPTRANSIVTSPSTFSLETSDIPSPEFSMQATYKYYVPRIDKLTLTRDKEFKLIKGTPSVAPVPPPSADDAMTLYSIFVPAYTANVAEIGIQYVENKRYTMRDIGAIEKRVENLEYYTALNTLELQSRNETILYENNVLEKEKYGIVTDDFSGFSVADAPNADLVCNISKMRLGPYRMQKPFKMVLESTSGAARQNERTVSVSFSEESCIVQNTATKAVTVQPYEFAQFFGSMKLYPETDYWYSTLLNPEVITNSTAISPQLEQPPGPTPPTPAPEINPAANVVNAPVTVGIPNVWLNQINPSDGFGAIEINQNWFGSSGLNLNNVNSNFTIDFGSNIPGLTGSLGGFAGFTREITNVSRL